MRRNVLVTAAIGKQGSALIRALLSPTTTTGLEYHIYALTRKASSPNAQKLAADENVTVVEGNLDDRDSVVKVFEDAKPKGGIWGVFAVLAFPGLGMPADGEERQGKMLADLALEYSVNAFVYSSQARAGPKYEDQLKLSPLAKSRIEQYCISLGEKGLPWTLLYGEFRRFHRVDRRLYPYEWIEAKHTNRTDNGFGADCAQASEDIGGVAAGVFNVCMNACPSSFYKRRNLLLIKVNLKHHEDYKHKTLTLCGDFLTTSELAKAYQAATGKAIPKVPGIFASLLLKMNKASQDLIRSIELFHHARVSSEHPELESGVEMANVAFPMRKYQDWVASRSSSNNGGKEAPAGGWNKLSVGKLVTCRS